MKKREGIRHAVYAVSFLLIAAALFVFFTYLFRETKTNQRRNILSYYLEEEDTVDVVYLGASSVYRFFSPLEAYERAGFTSFDYAAASMKEITYITAVRDIMRTQKPSLLLIDARRFTERKVQKSEDNHTLRYYTDSLDMGLLRFDCLLRCCRAYDLTFREAVPLFLDLCLYHNNTEALTDPLHWSLADNRVSRDTPGLYDKGYSMNTKVKPMEAPDPSDYETTAEITGMQEEQYRELCAYLSGLDTEVLIIVSAYIPEKGDVPQYNRMAEIAAEYGLPFLNCNRHADEIGYDYSTDFFNARHTNLLGAEKFTAYLTDYLTEHYELPDHRGEAAYADWDETLAEYLARAEVAREVISKRIADAN